MKPVALVAVSVRLCVLPFTKKFFQSERNLVCR